MASVTIVGMIYKSEIYLKYMLYGIKKYCLSSKKYDVDYLVVANDATRKILERLENERAKFVVYNDNNPNDYYLNRVYRAWNFGGKQAEGDILVFINSDMGFSPNWLENLLDRLDNKTIPCSRLVESGKLLSGEHAISKNFGKTPKEYNEEEFLTFAKSISEPKKKHGGLFMPCAFYKHDFENSGGYPEGNVYKGGPGAYKTKLLYSGDYYFFYKNSVMKDKKHITVFNSIVYHIQEGEKDV